MSDEPASGDDGAPSATSGTPPYIPFQTLLTFLSELKTNGLPPQIDGSVLKRFSGGTQNQLKVALRYLGLMEGSKPTEKLADLLRAYDTEQFAPALGALLQERYPFAFAIDLTTATPTMFADAFEASGARGEVGRKSRTFFIHAAKAAGVNIGPRILNGAAGRPSAGAAPRKKKAKAAPDAPAAKDDEPAAIKKPKPPEDGKDHPLIQGLLMTLPPPGKPFAADARVSWLRMASFIFENIYTGKGGITITAPGHKDGD